MKWQDFLPRVLPSVGSCPEPLALQHIVDAARVFAARTLVWQYAATPILSVANAADYTLQIDAGQELARILWVQVDGIQYTVPNAQRGRRLEMCNAGRLCIPTGPQDFRLSPAPQLDGLSIEMDIAVKPMLVGSVKWPDDLDEHVTDIVMGALGTLLDMPGVTWRDPEQAMAKKGEFAGRINTVQFKVSRNYGSSRQPTRVRVF